MTGDIAGLALEKLLAGSTVRIESDQFMAWARGEGTPNELEREALKEALVCMGGITVRRILFDGRASPHQIAKLVISVGGDEWIVWNNVISAIEPDLEVAKIDAAFRMYVEKVMQGDPYYRLATLP